MAVGYDISASPSQARSAGLRPGVEPPPDRPAPARRAALPAFPPRLVERVCEALPPPERDQLHGALANNIERRHGAPLRTLWRAYERGEVSLLRLEDEAGRPLFASFFQVDTLPDGTRRLDVRDTVSFAPAFEFTALFTHLVERHARELDCALITTTTYRPGLARRLLTRHGWQVAQVTLTKTIT